MQPDKITFSFGQNWKSFLNTVSEKEVASAMSDIEIWLGKAEIEGRKVIDIGSGSGIHSLAFYLLGAAQIDSVDVDPHSVQATRTVRAKAGNPPHWTVSEGSILDRDFANNLGSYDIVYSWGVLHHTGALWDAIENAAALVKPGGRFWFSIYAKGPRYHRDLALKKRYNAASSLGKRAMELRWIMRAMRDRIYQRRNPFGWNEKKERGMNVYHDIVDWLGGLPYEVADENEILQFLKRRQFSLEALKVVPEGACSIYVFSKIDR